MSNQAYANFTYTVDDINNTMRRTNALLRAVNAARLSVRDIRQLWQEPDLGRLMWTLVQLMRTYNSFRRIYRMVFDEANQVFTGSGLFGGIIYVPPGPPPIIDQRIFSKIFRDFALTAEANINGLPVPVTSLDISSLEELSAQTLQRVMEEEAPQIVADVKNMLNERIAGYSSPWVVRPTSGYLESTIGWEAKFPGIRVYAHAPYAWWVEEGQRTFPGHHYMKDGVQLSIPRLSEKIQGELNQLIFKDV